MGIKFRGQRIDDDIWVYGSYHYSAGGRFHYILALEKFVQDDDVMRMWKQEVNKVIPESVGQFTGVKDKFGNDIYVGDVVKNNAASWEVIFHTGCFCGRIITPRRKKDKANEVHIALRAINEIEIIVTTPDKQKA